MVEGACVLMKQVLVISYTHSPSVSHSLDSSLPEGAFESRDYRVILVVKKRCVRADTTLFLYACDGILLHGGALFGAF